MPVPVQLCGAPPDRFFGIDPDDESAILESPFHLRPPVPERNFLIPPPGSPLVGSRRARGRPTRYCSPETSFERLRVQREQEDCERAGSASRGIPENEDGVLSAPEGEAGVCVRVQNWSHRRRVAVARGAEGWD